MQGIYTPPAGQAVCPHCTATVVATVDAPAAAFVSLFNLRCPACGQRWHENRDPDGTATRYWMAVEQPA
jgi:hypothetical protein